MNDKALMLADWLENGRGRWRSSTPRVDSDSHRYLDCAKELRRLVAEVTKLTSMMDYCSYCHSAPGEACTFSIAFDGKEFKHERNQHEPKTIQD